MAEIGYQAEPEKDMEGHSGEFEIISPGWHKVVIIASEVKATKAGTGKILNFTYELQDGTKRTLIDRLNIVNPSGIAQKIGRGALGKIAVACGHKGMLSRTEPLHGRPFEVKISIEDYESNRTSGKMLKSNKCTDYRAVQFTSPTSETKTSEPVGW